jgi:hypothetical protein
MNKKMQQAISKLSIAAVLAAGSISANAFEFENDGWTLSLHGNVNANYIRQTCDSSATVVNAAFLCNSGTEDASAISNGYLPTSLEIGLATHNNGYDVAVTFATDSGLDENQAFNNTDNGNNNGSRIWLTVGNKDMGSVLLGRNWGLFGYDATFQDMSVYSVGGPFFTNSPANTSLGGAGTGYIFLDRITQATWTLPTSDAWVAQIGAFQPLDLFGGAETGSERVGFQGRLRFNYDGGFVSVTGINQDVDTGPQDFNASAYDLTAQYNIGNLALTGSYYMSDGFGHTGLLIDAFDVNNDAKESDGYYVQAQYTLGSTRFGVVYGETNVDNVTGETANALEEKSKITLGVYHSLASSITLTAEYSQVEAENVAGGELENDVFAVGAIYFF